MLLFLQLQVSICLITDLGSRWQTEKGNSQSSDSNRDLLRLAYEICEQNSHRDIEDLLSDIHYSLGAVANETNDAKSCFYHNAALLKIRETITEKNGKNDLRLGIAYNQMGTALMMTNNIVQAATSFQRAIDTYKELSNFNKYMLSIPLANLGLAYWLQDRLEKAYEVLKQGLFDRESMFGKDDHESFR